MTVYLIMDLDNLTQHELFEVRATEETAQARVDELNELKNKNDESASWIWDAWEVDGLVSNLKTSEEIHDLIARLDHQAITHSDDDADVVYENEALINALRWVLNEEEFDHDFEKGEN